MARHSAHVSASAPVAYEKLRAIDLNRSRGIRWLFTLRSLPARFGSRRSRQNSPRNRTFLESALAQGWVVLEEAPNRELVMGTVTQPWKPVVKFVGVPASQFVVFEEPGFAKIAWSIVVEPDASGSRVTLETRVLTTDAQSRQRFRSYWMVFSPFIKLIRRLILAQLQRELRGRT